MRTPLICLANSWKGGNRCIAGISPDTGKWIRPCYGDGTQGIPEDVRFVNGREPRLLDILFIPVGDSGPNANIQPENRSIIAGPWPQMGAVAAADLAPYCEESPHLLFSDRDRLHVDDVRALPRAQRKSLALVRVHTTF